MSRFLLLATPRLQAPLAAAVPLVLIASVLLHVSRVAHFAAGGARFVPIFVGASSVPIVRLLFLRRTRRGAYLGALLWPPLLAAFVVPSLVAYMRASAPNASYSFAGVSLEYLGPGWPIVVAILGAALGLLGSVALTALVWLIARAIAADEGRGARRFTITSWSIALGCAALTRLAFPPAGLTFANAGMLVATAGLLLQAAALVLERRGAAAAIGGPYR